MLVNNSQAIEMEKKKKKVHFTWGDVSEPIIQLKP